MERFIIYVYTKDSRIENARQSMKPYAESDSLPSLLRKGCFRNQLIKINVVVTQVILDGINSGGNAVEKIYAQCIQD
jgi:hypothetical protein